MAAERSPAFQFYPRDWLSDERVLAMDCASRGAYITLLSVCWLEGSLPTEPRAICRLAGSHHNEWKRISGDVLACFFERDGRYYQKRLELERERQAAFRQRQSEAGKRSAQRRLNQCSNIVVERLQPEVNSSSSSSSSIVQTPTVSESAADQGSAFAALWNEFTGPPIPKCREVTPKRRKLIASRLKERPLDEWPPVLSRLNASRFCRGENDRGWVATIDWALQPDTAVKVLEGKYDNRNAGQPANRAPDPLVGRWWDNCPHTPTCERLPDCQLRSAKEGQ